MHLTLTKIENLSSKKNTKVDQTKFSLYDAEIIIGGDFNFAENPKLDRHKCHEKQTDTSSHSFNDLKTNFGLVDLCRHMHPNKKQFTYRDISRFDMFIVSEELLGQIQ